MTRLTAAIILASVLVSSVGCTRFTRQRYETVYVGQPVSEAQEILGAPDFRKDGDLIYVNYRPYHHTIIHVQDGKVSGKEWSVDKSQNPCGCK
jgi:hypothetical protein